MTRYSPWTDLASRPGITLAVTRLPAGRAWWLADVQGIALDDRLDQVGRRVALTHELVHVDRGDVPCEGRYDRRQEKRCHAEAARRLIDVRDLGCALAAYGEQALDLIADELWVDVDTLCARLDHLHPAERHYLRRRLDEKEDAA